MNETIERKLEHMARHDRVELPDFERMWAKIEARTKRGASPKPAATQPGKNKLIYTAAVASCLICAVPVLASSSTWNWIKSYSPGVTAALEQGFGQAIEKSVTDQGTAFTLHRAVSDQNRITLDYSMPFAENKVFDTAFFSSIRLLDGSGSEIKGNQVNKRDDATGNLVGYFQTDASPKFQAGGMKLTAEGVNLLKQVDHPLALDAARTGEQEDQAGFDGIDNVKITSITLKAGQLVVDYQVHLTDAANAAYTNPSLKLSAEGGHMMTRTGGTVLPSDNRKQIVMQETYQAEQGLNLHGVRFVLTYNRLVDQIDGNWTVPFTLDTRKTKFASYTTKLKGETAPAAYQMNKLEELVVTPTQVRVNAKSLGFDSNWTELADYHNIQLKVGDRLLNGGMFADNGGISFRFEAPYSPDWASKPMALLLSDVTLERKSPKDSRLKLINPGAVKQTVQFPVGGYAVDFTYYKQGNDLILESGSANPAFGGMVQSYIADGKIFSDSRLNNGPSRSANWQKETFRQVADGDITVNPWLYTVVDNTQQLEIKLK